MTITDPQDVEWLADSGASSQMTGNTATLHNIVVMSVMVGNGLLLPISHVGDTNINFGQTTITVPDVLIIAEMKRNLLSVSKFIEDFSCYFIFLSDGFVIKQRSTWRILGGGSKRGGLCTVENGKVALFSTRNRTTPEAIWHQPLGHPQSKVLKFLFSQKLISVDVWNKAHSL